MSRPALRVIEGGGAHTGHAERPATGGVGDGSGSRARAVDVRQVPVERAGARSAGAALEARGPLSTSGRGFLSTALSTAGAWLIEPAEANDPAVETAAQTPASLRPVIAVFGLARGAGATVVARALAAELAGRDSSGTAAVGCDTRPLGIPLATQAASRLAEALQDVPGASTRAVGRLCLVEGAEHQALADTARHFAPLVLDAGSASVGGAAAAIADRTVLVSSHAVEPALARVAAACLERIGAESIIVLNRGQPDGRSVNDEARTTAGPGPDGRSPDDEGPAVEPGPDGWSRDSTGHTAGPRPDSRSCDGVAAGIAPRSLAYGPSDVVPLPDSRLGAQLALGGREARGELGRAIAEVADWCGMSR